MPHFIIYYRLMKLITIHIYSRNLDVRLMPIKYGGGGGNGGADVTDEDRVIIIASLVVTAFLIYFVFARLEEKKNLRSVIIRILLVSKFIQAQP